MNVVHLLLTLFIFDFPIGNSETYLCFILVNPSRTVPPLVVPLLQIQFAAICIYSEGQILMFIQIRYYF